MIAPIIALLILLFVLLKNIFASPFFNFANNMLNIFGLRYFLRKKQALENPGLVSYAAVFLFGAAVLSLEENSVSDSYTHLPVGYFFF